MSQNDVRRIPLDDFDIEDKPAGVGDMFYHRCDECGSQWSADENESVCYECGAEAVFTLL